MSSTEEYTSTRGGRPKFVDDGYLSILIRDLKKGRPWRGLQKVGVKILYEHSDFAKHIIENPGGEKALNDIYVFPSEDHYTWLDRRLLGLNACEGTRRRKEEYQNRLKEMIVEMDEKNPSGLNVIDLGSGRGSVLIEPIHHLIQNNRVRKDGLHIVLVDRDEEALEIGKGICDGYGLSDITEFKNYNVKDVSSKEDRRYHIVGTHGLLDYFQDEEAIQFFQDISKILVPEGIVITTNMTPHDDLVAQMLMEKFGKWVLKYRRPEEFKKLIENSGGYKIIDTRIVADRETYILDGRPSGNDIKGFHVIVTAKKE